MTDPYHIRGCRLADLRALAFLMRPCDRSEIVGLGLEPRHVLSQLYRESPDPQMAEYGGEIAAAWGDCGGLLSSVGTAWLFTTPMVERAPLAFFRHAREWANNRLMVRQSLVSSIRADYTAALRFFAMIGFEIKEPQPLPPHGILYSVIEMRR